MSSQVNIPRHFVEALQANLGHSADEWLEDLPAIVGECVENWSLTIGEPFAELSFNYVAPVTRLDGSSAVLKVGVTGENLTEAAALGIFNGRGIARLLGSDGERGALLLERLKPGRMLAELADDVERTRIAADIMQQLWRPIPDEHSFPTVADWGKGFDRLRRHFEGSTGPLPSELVEAAESMFAELVASQGEQVLLHGDLHHYNILSAARQPWLAIDPKGVVGEAEYEPGALFRNMIDALPNHPDPRELTARRIDQLSEQLGFDRRRVHAWTFAQAVLSAWWDLEDSGSVDPFWIELAESIRSVRR